MSTPRAPRFVAIVYTSPAGAILYAHVLDNRALTTHLLMSEQAPPWFRERVALLRLCEVSHEPDPGPLGRRFSTSILHLFMTAPEYRQLRRIIDSPDEMPVDGEQRDIAFARAARFKSRVGDAAFRAWMRGLLERFSN